MRHDVRRDVRLGAMTLAALLAAGAARAEPASYDTPEAAVAAVVAAIEARDPQALIAVFGAENDDLVLTGDVERDRRTWGDFYSDYRELHRLDVENDGRAVLYTGRDQWPFPAELVEAGGHWRFDAAGAREEILFRRIGQNELDVIDLMHRYARAQAAFRSVDYDGDGVLEFASSIISDTGERDGLYWPPEPGAPESPIGDFMARAAADGYSLDGEDREPEPYLGYYFRVLQRQGPDAPGGAIDYMIGGHMLGGHALLAFPAAYGETGVMSFMIGEAGVVYEADLGEDTLAKANAIDAFEPGEGWERLSE